MRTSPLLLYGIVLIVGFVSPVFADQSGALGLVSVQSTYSIHQVQGPKRTSTIIGAGTVFETLPGDGPVRTLVLTSSHVSQGDLGDLRINGLAGVLGRAMIGGLELIEVPRGTQTPAGVWHPSTRRIWLSPESVESITHQRLPLRANDPAYSVASSSILDNRLHQFAPAFVPRPSWCPSNPRASVQDFHTDELGTQVDANPLNSPEAGLVNLPLSGEKFAKMAVTPGMSGEPLVDVTNCPRSLSWENRQSRDYFDSMCLTVAGVTNRFYLDGSGTFFSSDEDIAKLVEFYLREGSGRQTVSGAFRWSLDGGVLHREYQDGSSELNIGQSPAGNHLSGDPGVSVLPGISGNLKCSYEDPSRLLRNIPGGITWKGSRTYALNYGAYGLLNADALTHDVAERLSASGCEGSAIGTDVNFEALLRQKVLKSREAGQIAPTTMAQLQRSNEAFRIGDRAHRGFVNFDGTLLTFNLHLSHGDGDSPFDHVQFRLDRQGRQIDAKGRVLQAYTGTIHVTGETGNGYEVDLNSLFFADSLYFSKNPGEFSAQLQPSQSPQCSDLLRLYQIGPVVKISLKDFGLSYFFTFTHPEM